MGKEQGTGALWTKSSLSLSITRIYSKIQVNSSKRVHANSFELSVKNLNSSLENSIDLGNSGL